MTFKKTADTFEAGAHTLSREYYTDVDILEKEYQQIFLKKLDLCRSLARHFRKWTFCYSQYCQ